YYNPDDIPVSFRKAFVARGIVPWSRALVRHGGLNSELANACDDGGGRNGVLTAVEDFLDTTQVSFEFLTVAGFNGLGVLCPTPVLEASKPLRSLVAELKATNVLGRHLESLESARVHGELQL